MLKRIGTLVGIAGVLFSAYTLKEQFFPKPKLAEAGHGDHGGGGHGAEVKTTGKTAAVKDDHAGHDHGTAKAATKSSGVDHSPAKSGTKADDHAGHGHGDESGNTPEGVVSMSAAQIAKARIETAPAMNGNLAKEIVVPGRVALNGDRQARIVPKLPGTVSKVMKNVGQAVAVGEVLAVIESREIADAKAEYLGAWRAEELAKSVYDREQRLWKQ
ncbi:MAG: efflux RND transporter periplasmic adaptor subunit, partial [Hyphomicrobiaceae bacterium]|nr:efflux RND transporter periplasmic adaptor subunit [Hyphomicrobiaceae bacterium]